MTIRITPRRQLRATKKDTGSVIAAISAQVRMFSMEVSLLQCYRTGHLAENPIQLGSSFGIKLHLVADPHQAE